MRTNNPVVVSFLIAGCDVPGVAMLCTPARVRPGVYAGADRVGHTCRSKRTDVRSDQMKMICAPSDMSMKSPALTMSITPS